MKKFIVAIVIFLLALNSFSEIIKFDNYTLNATNINFETVEEILEKYSKFLSTSEISTGTIGSFNYIEWEDKIIYFSKNVVVLGENALDNPNFDDIFNFFNIKYLKKENEYNFAEMVITKVEDFGSYLQFDYLGKNFIDIEATDNAINIISKGLIYFKDNLYEPGSILLTKNIDSSYKTELNILPKRTIVQFIKEYNIKNIIVKLFGEKIEKYDSKSFAIIFKDSNINAVFVPNYSPDFSGNDWKVFSISDKFGKLVSKKFNLKLFYVPFVQVPKDLPAIVIFTSQNSWKQISEFVEGELQWKG